MSSRMRVTKGHTGNRRSHHHIKEPRLSKCANCGAYHLRHRVCPECGYYRGKMVVDVVAKQEARLKKMQAKTATTEASSNKVEEKTEKNKKTESETKSNKSSKAATKRAGAKKKESTAKKDEK